MKNETNLKPSSLQNHFQTNHIAHAPTKQFETDTQNRYFSEYEKSSEAPAISGRSVY